MANNEVALEILRDIHTAGLHSELNGSFDLAHETFGFVLNGLGLVETKSNDFITATVLKADTLRDDGYTSLRHALRDAKPELFERAEAGLLEALDVTASLSSDYASLPYWVSRSGSELFTAHAKTEGCLGRLVVAQQVSSGALNLNEPASTEQREAQHWFGRAHRHALSGDSAYTGASIAITAARTEVINGSAIRNLPWLKRAGTFVLGQWDEGLRWHDRIDAVGTIVHHREELKNRSTAMAAATHWRSV
jgi:hypothetical protein